MEKVKYEIYGRRVKKGIVLLGARGDVGVRTLEFDLPWMAENQIAYLKMDLPVPMKAPLSEEEGAWRWTVASGATAHAGEFRAQLEILCGDSVVWNSDLFFVMVKESLDANEEIEEVMLPELLTAQANLAQANARTEEILAAVDAEEERVLAEQAREDYINALKSDVAAGAFDGQDGEPGEPGEKGNDGKNAYQYAQENGYTGTEAEFAQMLASAGASAYEIALENGFEGTEQEWLESLHGADGADGIPGVGIVNITIAEV